MELLRMNCHMKRALKQVFKTMKISETFGDANSILQILKIQLNV